MPRKDRKPTISFHNNTDEGSSNDNTLASNQTSNSNPNEETHLEKYSPTKKVNIPESGKRWFIFKKLYAFTGPGFLISIAYLDAGNIESDLRSGSIARYSLLWVLLLASILGLFMQRLAARLGVVTGLHLAEMCHIQYRRLPRIFLWVMVEIAIIASDAQQVIGTAVAIYLLSNRVIPLWIGVIITIADTFIFLFMGKYGLRKLEIVFGCSIMIMGFSFGYQYVVSHPDPLAVVQGMLTPHCEACDYSEFVQGSAVVGSVIMPHNIFLHSALVKSREVDKSNIRKVKEANRYFFVEAAIAVFISFLINTFVVSQFASGLYKLKNNILSDRCRRSRFGNVSFFPDNEDFVKADLFSGGIFLGCTYGLHSMYIWGVGILASGQSATMTGTYAGQFAMEGFLNLKWPRWVKVLFTRSVAIVPTFILALFAHIEQLTDMNDIMNVINCVQLPFAAIPIIAFTSNREIMGEDFVNNWFNKSVAVTLSIVVISTNTYFVITSVMQLKPNGAILGVVISVGVTYLTFCVYLVIHMVAFMDEVNLMKCDFVKKYVMRSTMGYSRVD